MEYLVKRGDTLGRIARQNNTTVEELARLNNIKNVNLIRTGATLRLPGTSSKTGAGAAAKNPLESYRDAIGSLTAPTYEPADTSAYYNQAAARYADALSTVKNAARQSAAARAEALSGQYEALRRQTYAGARLSAIGNNERLAAKGLAGNLYADARSGASETSRVAQDTALRTAIAQANSQEQEARDALALSLLQAESSADENYANNLANLALKQAAAQQQAQQDDFSAKWKQYETALGLIQQLYDNTRDQEKVDAQAAEAAAKATKKSSGSRKKSSSSGSSASGTSGKKSTNGKSGGRPLTDKEQRAMQTGLRAALQLGLGAAADPAYRQFFTK